MRIVIPVEPRTKKNSMRLVKAKGRIIPIPSKEYQKFERDCAAYMPKVESPIDFAVNVECVYYMPTRRRVDLTNLMEATHDILVKYKVLADDNCKIIQSVDGSRVLYDKENPRTEIEITRV